MSLLEGACAAAAWGFGSVMFGRDAWVIAVMWFQRLERNRQERFVPVEGVYYTRTCDVARVISDHDCADDGCWSVEGCP